MTRPIIRFHNAETNEIIDREMNDKEFAQYEKDLELSQKRRAETQAKDDAKVELLNRLGITAEEAATLLS
jgi:hypothetical protein